jgi:hypothetical protein
MADESSMNAFKWRISFILIEVWTSISIKQFTSSILIIVWISVLWPVEKEHVTDKGICDLLNCCFFSVVTYSWTAYFYRGTNMKCDGTHINSSSS